MFFLQNLALAVGALAAAQSLSETALRSTWDQSSSPSPVGGAMLPSLWTGAAPSTIPVAAARRDVSALSMMLVSCK